MLKYYRNCDELPIFNFYEILKTKNYAYLYLDYDGYDDMVAKDNFQDVFQDIYEEYVNLIGDNTTLIYYELIKDVLYLETRYKVVSSLMKNMTSTPMNKETRKAYIGALRKWRYKIDEKKDFGDEMIRVVRQLKASKNALKIKQSELKALREKNDNGSNLTLVQQEVKLEQALSRNNVDTKKTSVTKWVYMIKEIEVINQANRNRNSK